MLIMLSTKTDIGITVASTPTVASAMTIAITPTITGSTAATSAPKARTRITRVIGTRRRSLRLASSALVARMSTSSAVRPVTRTV